MPLGKRNRIRILYAVTAFVLLCTTFTTDAHGQAATLANPVNLRDAIGSIERSSGFRFTFRDRLIDDKRVDASSRTFSLTSFLRMLESIGIDSAVDSSLKQVLLIPAQADVVTDIVGRIVDDETGEELPYATVSWQTERGLAGVAASSSGTFTVPRARLLHAQDSTILRFSYLGYKQREMRMSPDGPGTPLTIRLRREQTFSPEVVVSDFLLETDLDSSFVKLMSPRLASPLGESNVVKSLQSLPSVSLSYGMSSGLSVRGSRNDGFQVLLDGIPIYNQSHFFGMFDALNEDALKSVGFYYGITPANFQGPPGGTLSFVTRSGSRIRFEQTYGLSNTSGKLTVGGPLPAKIGAWILSLRRSFMSEVDWFNNADLIEQGLDVNRRTSVTQTFANRRDVIFPGSASASYYDAHAKVGLDVSSRSRIAISAYSGGDKSTQLASRFVPIDDAPVGGDRAKLIDVSTHYMWGSDAVSLQFLASTPSGTLLTGRAGFSRFNNDYVKDDFVYSIPPPEDRPGLQLSLVDTLANTNRLRDYVLAQEVSYSLRDSEIAAGATLHVYEIEFHEDSSIRERPYEERTNATLAEAFVEYRTPRGRNFTLQIGSRVHHLSNGSFFRLSPRLRGQVGNDYLSTYAGYSRNYQFLHRLYVENTVGSYLWTISREGQPPGVADNFVTGLTIRPSSAVALQVDGYYKRFANLRQHESVVTRRRLRATGAILSPWVHDTRGQSRGVEFIARSRIGRATVSNSYALTNTTVSNDSIQDGKVFPAEWDRPHQFSSRLSLALVEALSIDATFSLASGAPNVLAFVDESESERLDTYHRLDLGVEFRGELNGVDAQVRFNLFNAYDRDNAWYRTNLAVLKTDRFRDGVEFVNADVYDLGIQPSFDIRLRF